MKENKRADRELIVVKQLPVIEEHLKAISAEIDQRIALADSLVCSEDTVKQVKVIRAELNKELEALEERRKAVKAAVMAPYNDFEAIYKQYASDKYKAADERLKLRIAAVEDELKLRKWEEVRDYFEEYRTIRGVDFASMDTWHPNITLSVTAKKLKEEAQAYIDRICDDLALIETQEHKAEILVEYRRSLNVSQAITSVSERHRAIEEQKAKQAEQEARRAAEAEAVSRVEAVIQPTLAPPTMEAPADAEPVRTLAFRVTAPLSKLLALKKFLEEGGYQYE